MACHLPATHGKQYRACASRPSVSLRCRDCCHPCNVRPGTRFTWKDIQFWGYGQVVRCRCNAKFREMPEELADNAIWIWHQITPCCSIRYCLCPEFILFQNPRNSCQCHTISIANFKPLSTPFDRPLSFADQCSRRSQRSPLPRRIRAP